MRKRVMVVAHPDDETIWAGGLVLLNPGDWTIISCQIPKIDPVRSDSFLQACRLLGAKGVNRPQALDPDFHFKLGDMDLSGYDHIVTHGQRESMVTQTISIFITSSLKTGQINLSPLSGICPGSMC